MNQTIAGKKCPVAAQMFEMIRKDCIRIRVLVCINSSLKGISFTSTFSYFW